MPIVIAGSGSVGASIQTWEVGLNIVEDSLYVYENSLYQAIESHTAGDSFEPSKFQLIGTFSASLISVNTDNFDKLLTTSETNVQLALEKLDDHEHLNAISEVASTPAQNVTIDTNMVVVDAAATPVTINLYSANGKTGKEVGVRKTDNSTKAVTVVPSGSETINGQSSIQLTSQYELVTLKSDGTNWYVANNTAYTSDPRIHIGATPPTDTAMLWFDTN